VKSDIRSDSRAVSGSGRQVRRSDTTCPAMSLSSAAFMVHNFGIPRVSDMIGRSAETHIDVNTMQDSQPPVNLQNGLASCDVDFP